MNTKNMFLTTILVMLLAVNIFAAGQAETTKTEGLDRSKHFITVATGPTSGLYYP
ncbi:MAG: C4-dicarboxylate ABC transporter substrate-binding protein, partial [Spirochaetia bacterium]|nr:C4-dicarboxylate ABC transporter substrate-binding protein [Spirochaetia bacterium]